MNVDGHVFHKSGCERRCWACGFVVGADENEAEIRERLREEEKPPTCTGRWHDTGAKL